MILKHSPFLSTLSSELDKMYLDFTLKEKPRLKRSPKKPAVMYLPLNEPKVDPCAPQRGSKLMKALPLIFLSSLLSVADAVGNIVNNLNSNNNNNNANVDNNINNNNVNVAASVVNANQVNFIPPGGRAIAYARNVLHSMSSAAQNILLKMFPR